MRSIVIRNKIHSVLLNIRQHLQGDRVQTNLCVTHGRRIIAIDGTEVAVPIHKGIAAGKILRQTHQGVINSGVAMRMKARQNITHHNRALFMRFVRGNPGVIHGIEYSPLHRLKPVAHIRKSAPYDDAHGIVQI